MAESMTQPQPLQAPEPELRGRILKAVTEGYLPGTNDFFKVVGRGADYYGVKPSSEWSMWDKLSHSTVFGGYSPKEQKAMQEQQAINAYAESILPKIAELNFKTPTAEEAGGFFQGGRLPFTPTASQRQPIVPTPDELQAYQREEAAGRLLPLPQPLSQNQPVGFDPTRFNPEARLTPYQSGILEEAGKGQVVLPGQQFLPTTLAKGEKQEKPSYHYTTMLNPDSGVEEEVRIDVAGNKQFLGPKGSPEAAKAKKQTHDLEYRREVENEAKTRIGRAFAFAGFKESPFDATGNIDVARLLAPGAVDLDNLMYWAESAINEPKLQKDVKIQLQHFLTQIKDAVKRKKPSAQAAPAAATILKFDSKGNPIK